MSQPEGMSGPQFRGDRPAEQDAVRTMIVGGQKLAPIPRGIEVLLRKASVDAAFKELLLRERGGAAEAIGLKLESGEAMMLTAATAEQLEAVIARTVVPQEHRRAFLGQAASVMLATLGTMMSITSGCEEETKGIRPDRPPTRTTGGSRPDRMDHSQGTRPHPMPLAEKERSVEERVIEIISNRTGVEANRITRNDTLVKDPHVRYLVELRRIIEVMFDIEVPVDDFNKIGTVGEMIDYVEKALKNKPSPKPQYPDS